MARRNTRRTAFQELTLAPPGIGGLDLDTAEQLVDENRLRAAEFIRLSDRAMSRALGGRKAVALSDITAGDGSWTFGATTEYATFPHAAHLLIPVGSWGYRMSITAVRPGPGNTAHIIATRVSTKSFGPLSLTLDENGVLTSAFRKESDESNTVVQSTALAAGATAHIWGIFDADAGTWSLYIDGSEDGTAITGLSSTEQPMQDGPAWHFGVEWDPDVGPAPTANSEFSGKCDAFTLFTFRGNDLTKAGPGGKSLLDTLLQLSFQEWPNPESAMVLAHFGFDEDSTTAFVDASRFKNNGTFAGSPTTGARVALQTVVGNLVRKFQAANGKLTNVVAAGGSLYSQDTRSATS